MPNQATMSSKRAVTRGRPLYLRSISHPLSRREAEQLFARQEAADSFGRHCA